MFHLYAKYLKWGRYYSPPLSIFRPLICWPIFFLIIDLNILNLIRALVFACEEVDFIEFYYDNPFTLSLMNLCPYSCDCFKFHLVWQKGTNKFISPIRCLVTLSSKIFNFNFYQIYLVPLCSKLACHFLYFIKAIQLWFNVVNLIIFNRVWSLILKFI